MLSVYGDLQSNRSNLSLSEFFPFEAVSPLDTDFFFFGGGGVSFFFSAACCHALDMSLKSFLLRFHVLKDAQDSLRGNQEIPLLASGNSPFLVSWQRGNSAPGC